MTLVLNDDDVAAVLTMEDCIAELEAAYRDMGLGTAVNAPRRDTFLPSSRPDAYYSFKTFEGGLERLGVMAQRINSDLITYPMVDGAPRRVKVPAAPGNRYVGLVFLYSTETLELLAIITDGHLQRMRVAGTTGVAAKHLARADARTVALIGSGWQAEAAAWALASVRSLSDIRVYSPSEDHRTTAANALAARLGITVTPVDSAEAAVAGADIVACATNSHGPVLESGLIEEGQHVTSVLVTELDDEAYRRADLVIHSTPRNYYSSQSGKISRGGAAQSNQDQGPVEDGRWEAFAEKSYALSDVLTGQAPARTNLQEVTLCNKSWGLGIEFASVGKLVVDRAKTAGIGHELPTDWFSQTSHP